MLLLLDLSPHIRAHMAVALRVYVQALERQARRDGTVVPPELGRLAELLHPSRVTTPERDGEDSLNRKRRLAADRARRYRERVKRDAARQLAS